MTYKIGILADIAKGELMPEKNKVEELPLYTIDQKKQLDQQKAENVEQLELIETQREIIEQQQQMLEKQQEYLQKLMENE